jgi:hypothetical protein
MNWEPASIFLHHETARSPAENSQGVDAEIRRHEKQQSQSPKSSRSRFVCARLTGISLCFLSSMRNW